MIALLQNTKFAALFCSAMVLLVYSCQKVDAGSGPKVDKRVEIQNFNKIVLHCGGTLNYRQGDHTAVKVNTTQEAFDALNIYVDNKTLHIKSKSGIYISSSEEMIFDITDDDTYSIEVRGSGDVTADFDENYYFAEHYLTISGSGNIDADAVNGDMHNSKISGSGNISIGQLNVSNAVADISGSGNIEFISGNTPYSNLIISGSGNVNSFDVTSLDVDVKSSGSGTVSLKAVNKLNISLSDSGTVYYKGYPVVTSSVSGSGHVYDAN